MARHAPGLSVSLVHALILTYELRASTPAEHDELYEQLAPAVGAVPGLVSHTRLANEATGRYGGIFRFESRRAFERFVASELFEALCSHRAVRSCTASDFAVTDRGAPEAGATTTAGRAG